jgi:hypothetical protein
MDENQWHNCIVDIFHASLDALKECEPGTAEWRFCWATLENSKYYFEQRAERLRKKKE